MKKSVTIALLFVSICMVRAQSAALRFVPKWSRKIIKTEAQLFTYTNLIAPQKIQTSVPQVWCYNDLAFFCKIEVKMEKAARFPIKFRLGDVQYVERLEGKVPSY